MTISSEYRRILVTAKLEILDLNEEVLAITGGKSELDESSLSFQRIRGDFLIVTNNRLIYWKRNSSSHHEYINYNEIAEIIIKKGITTKIELFYIGRKISIKSNSFKNAIKIEKLINERSEKKNMIIDEKGNLSQEFVYITGKTSAGKEFKEKIVLSAERIDLSDRGLKFLDISQLCKCKNLKFLNIQNNKLSEIILPSAFKSNKLGGINLNYNSLDKIDLGSFSTCPNFTVLGLSNNKFTSIDLSPLKNNKEVLVIFLNANRLKEIDLSPLVNSKLYGLMLNNNKIKSINLEPLASCSELFRLTLFSNQIDSLDLAPLSSCKNLKEFGFHDNKIRTINIAPLFACPNLATLSGDDDIEFLWEGTLVHPSDFPPAFKKVAKALDLMESKRLLDDM